jgi:integrase
MASFTKRGRRWQAQVCANGQRRANSFATKREAQAWAAETETELRRPAADVIADKTLGELLERYGREVSPTKRGGDRREQLFIQSFLRDEFSQVKLSDLSPAVIADWRDRRLRSVSGSTVQREMNILSHACNVARKEWGWLAISPMTDVSRPRHNPARSRLPTQDEIERMMFALGYERDELPVRKMARVGWAFLFALETAMRAGEIVAMTWDDVSENTVHIPKTKNAHPRDVPLSPEANRLLDQLKPLADEQDAVLGVASGSLDVLWRKARKAALVDGLHFHDSRRAALTKMAKVFSVMELARISGHRDLRILQNVYYAPDMDELAKKLR